MADRVRVALACDECGARNYHITRARGATTQKRISKKKFCPACNKHTPHSESR